MLAKNTLCFCGALLLVASALQGCDNEAAETETGRSFEQGVTRDLSDDSVTELSAAMQPLVANSNDEEAKNKVVTALENVGLIDVFDKATQTVFAETKDCLLYVNVTMKPLRLAGNLVRMCRAEDDCGVGPIFAVKLPLVGPSCTDWNPNEIQKDFMKTKVHIEGFASVALFAMGHFKLKVNQGPNKFELAFTKMKIVNLFEASGDITVDDKDVVKAKGAFASWFDEDFVKEVVQAITDAAKPLQDEIERKQAELTAECNACGTGLINEGCRLLKCIDWGKIANDLIGQAADAVSFIIEKAGAAITEIFTLKEASFETIVDASSAELAKLTVKVKATVFGKNVDETVAVSLKDAKAAALDVAKAVAKEIFDERDKIGARFDIPSHHGDSLHSMR